MPGKARVHELAKELGMDSKTVLSWLKDNGEFVKSASSTVEAPVARKLREAFPATPAASAAPAPAARAAAPAAAPAATTPPAARPTPGAPRPAAASAPAAPAQAPASPAGLPRRPGAPMPGPARPAAPAAPAAPMAPAASAAPSAPPRPGPASPGRPGPTPGPRPGNNPFSTPADGTPGMPPRPPAARPGSRDARHAAASRCPVAGQHAASGCHPRHAAASGRPASRSGRARVPARACSRPVPARAVLPVPAVPVPVPACSRPAAPARVPGMPGARPGGGPGGPGGAGRPGGPGGPGGGGGFAGRPGGGGFGGRPGGPRGGAGKSATPGAFGRSSGRPVRGKKSKKQRRQEFDNLAAPTMGGGVARGNGESVRLPRGASLADFADRINANPGSLVQVVFTELNEMVTATQSCTDETLQLLGAHLGYDVQIVTPEEEDAALLDRFDLTFGAEYGDDANLVVRPPVVTIMGHVDHGKTLLLDSIRSTDVVKGEAGGITQHIGAYQVHHPVEGGVREVTFVDTPGHEAFTAMRARGAKVTDIVVLVVAADDGVKPQTIEALNHAQAAEVPIVVAVNKVDKEGADPAKVRGQLTEYGLVAEEYGGTTMFVDVSAKARTGLDDLLDAILLTTDAELELLADATVNAQGVAIEARLDKGRGAVATVLVQRGTLHVGDSIVAGDAFGRVRAMLNERGENVSAASPGPAGPGARLHERPRRRRQLPRRRRGPRRPADRRAAGCARAQRRPRAEPWAPDARVAVRPPQGG